MLGPQKKIFGLIVLIFSVAVTAMSIQIFRSHHVEAVNYAAKTQDFARDGVPNFALPLLDTKTGIPTGENFKLQNSESRVLLINFWASWCEPCQTEFPSLVNLARKFEKQNKVLNVVAVSVDHDQAPLQAFLAAVKEPLPSNFYVVSDPDGNIAGRYGTHKLPETYIVDGQHKLLRKVIDSQNWTAPGFLGVLDGFMGLSK